MKEVLEMVGAYEHASCVGLPEIVMHSNMESSLKTLRNISDYFRKEKEYNSLAREFTEVLSILFPTPSLLFHPFPPFVHFPGKNVTCQGFWYAPHEIP